MRNVEQVSSVKNELLDIFMSMEVAEHKQRQKSAAVRYLRARRGIELHNEFKQLERDIAGFDDELMQ
ncbi:PA3496 family putative envelope integrity protein [Litchfieldella rifensis]|uniref:PA3496 family putative envelope integrity protein n=1 Tax=Litchfieldella rifensis TaxID=762643 RepID=A0ABV7LP24_9GAMM